jgi:glycerol kinase
VPAFSGLFAPYWRADARSAIVGLSRFHTSAHSPARRYVNAAFWWLYPAQRRVHLF